MSQSQCGICRAKTDDAYLCETHTDELELAIAEIPALMHHLRVAITRQARVFRTSTPRRVDLEWADPEGAVPAQLRSRDGRITLPTTAMPVDLDAATLNADAWTILTDWAVKVAELTGRPALPMPRVYRRLYVDRNRMRWSIHIASYRVEPSAVCTWLVAGVDRLRLDEAGPRAYRQLTRLKRRIERGVDMHPPGEFIGHCDAADVRIETSAAGTLTPRLATCGAELYAPEGEHKIACDVCGAEYDAVTRRREMASTVDDEWARPHTIARALSQLEHPVKPDTLRKWIERDARLADRLAGRPAPYPLIVQRGVDDDGKPVYRVGDVRERVERIRTERETDCA